MASSTVASGGSLSTTSRINCWWMAATQELRSKSMNSNYEDEGGMRQIWVRSATLANGLRLRLRCAAAAIKTELFPFKRPPLADSFKRWSGGEDGPSFRHGCHHMRMQNQPFGNDEIRDPTKPGDRLVGGLER